MSAIILEFKNEYRWLSNFYPVIVFYEGLKYSSVEHAYQAAKSLDRAVRVQIQNCATAGAAKKFGKKIIVREDWDQIKLQIMFTLLQQKFAKGSNLASKLIETFPKELQEGNYWNDTFWGINLKTNQGLNHLGKLLMQIRAQLLV